MVDLGFIKPIFTWSNKRNGENQILQWNDKSLPTREWCETFPYATIIHLDITSQGWQQFKFERRWDVSLEYNKVIQDAWVM